MKTFILSILTVFVCFSISRGQQDPHYSQFMFNKLYFNPAYAGSQDGFSLSAIYRNQWIGITGAPQTATLLGHGAVLSNKLGLGMSITYDQIGFTNRIDLETNYAYRILFKNNSFLSIGIRGSAYYLQIRWDQANPIDMADNSIPGASMSKLFPNFGAGIYYQARNYYIGFSVPHIFRNRIDFTDNINASIEPRLQQHYFAMGGMSFDLSANVALQSNILCKFVQGAPFDMDFNVSVVFLKKLLFGVTYRLGDSVDALVRWRITQRFQLALAYDFSISQLQRFNAGSVEAMLQYNFYKKMDKVHNPRFF